MKFDGREWVNDIVAGTLTGAIAGVVGALFIPDPPIGLAMAAGGTAGLMTGLLTLPIKWLMNRLRPPNGGT